MKNNNRKFTFKIKIWDEFGKPIDKVKGYPKDINARLKKVFKKYS